MLRNRRVVRGWAGRCGASADGRGVRRFGFDPYTESVFEHKLRDYTLRSDERSGLLHGIRLRCIDAELDEHLLRSRCTIAGKWSRPLDLQRARLSIAKDGQLLLHLFFQYN